MSLRKVVDTVRSFFGSLSREWWWEGYNMGRELEAEAEGIGRGVWSAVMDSGTCKFCQWADGRSFKLGQIDESPPAHHGCRCIIAYYDESELLLDGTSSEEEFDNWESGPPANVFPLGSR